ncbi:MAG: hypothetical protein AABX00_05210 [Nanoarchaeota archaeon]
MRKIILVLLLVLASAMASGLSEDNYNANLSISRAENIVAELNASNLPNAKAADLLFELEQNYEVQTILESNNATADYSKINGVLDEIISLSKEAYSAHDELVALNSFIETQRISGTDVGSAEVFYTAALREFNYERFDKSRSLVEEAYNAISESKAATTKAKTLYRATTNTIEEFFARTWRYWAASSLLFLLLFVLSYKAVKRIKLKARIRRLEQERETVKNLIKEIQRKYFEKGEISESEYHIKTKKYAEIIRDINRRIPLLEEEIALTKKIKSRYSSL